MIPWLSRWWKKQSLIQQGLHCDRKRQLEYASELVFFLDCSPVVRTAILILGLLGTIRVSTWHSTMPLWEIVVWCVLLFGVILFMMPMLAREVWKTNRLLALVMICFVGNLLLNKTLFVLLDKFTVFDIGIATDLLVPAVLGPMLVTILISCHAGILLALLLAAANNVFLGGGQDPILLSSLLTGLASVLFTRRIRRRSNLLMAGVAVGLVGLGCTLLQGGVTHLSAMVLLVHGIWAVFLGVVTAFVVGAVLPVFEWMFDRITDISWLELTDLNHPLLKRLIMEAPGTYHHSLMVGNLAEAGAQEIGANPGMCRVLSYFHDIGKLTKPNYFIENSSVEENPHNDLAPSMSALIIIAHVKEGVDMAITHGLPNPVIDAIQQHHGTTLVYYFYRKALQQMEDARRGSEILKMRKEDMPEVEEASFRYSGPIPQFKESAIVSLADSIESSSRNLTHPTPQAIETLVNDIIKQRLDEGQLDDSQLTLQEIRRIAERFIFTLKTMLHARIQYPSAKEKDSEDHDS
ncbi:MAG: HD family phosphohydrolase [Verrucomicrobiota bacterium]